MNEPWPIEVRLAKDRRSLTVVYEDGRAETFTAEFLRTQSPSAEVQGHAASQRQVVPGKAGVAIERLDSVGHYAVKPRFSDGHDTGLFSWDYFAELARERDALWSRYLAELAERGLSRGEAVS